MRKHVFARVELLLPVEQSLQAMAHPLSDTAANTRFAEFKACRSHPDGKAAEPTASTRPV